MAAYENSNYLSIFSPSSLLLSSPSPLKDEWLTCQRNWLYLESIFLAPDIKRQLPAESKMFVKVDKSWRRIMSHVNKTPNALKASTQPGRDPYSSDRKIDKRRCLWLTQQQIHVVTYSLANIIGFYHVQIFWRPSRKIMLFWMKYKSVLKPTWNPRESSSQGGHLIYVPCFHHAFWFCFLTSFKYSFKSSLTVSVGTQQ